MPLKIAQAPVIRVRPRKSGNWVVKDEATLTKIALAAVAVVLAAGTWVGSGVNEPVQSASAHALSSGKRLIEPALS